MEQLPSKQLTSVQLAHLTKTVGQLLSVSEQQLKSDIERYMSAKYSGNTKKTYLNNWTQFVAYCKAIEEPFLPASYSTVIKYLTALSSFRSTSTILQHHATIKAAHELSALNSPTNHPHVKTLIAGIKKSKGVRQKQALPISLDLLQHTISDFEKQNPDELKMSRWKLWKAIILLAWWGCFRESEINNLNYEDIVLDNDGLTILITDGKGDKNKEGAYKYIPMLKKTPSLCPVIALENWLAWASIEKGAVFREVERKTTKGEHKDTIQKERLKKRSLYYAVTVLFGKQYSSHSLRVGFSVEAYERGASEGDIQRAGNWKNPKMVARYTKQAKVKKRNAANVLIN